MLLRPHVQKALEIDTADEIRHAPHGVPIDECYGFRAVCCRVDGNIGCGLGTSQYDDIFTCHRGRICVFRAVDDITTRGLKRVLARMGNNVLVRELSGADRDKIKVLRPGFAGRFQRKRPAGQAVVSAIHGLNVRVQLKQPGQFVFVRIGMKIGMDLWPLRPFGIFVRHGKIGVSVKIFRGLGLDARIGTGQFPDTAKIVASLKTEHPMAAFIEGLGRGKATHAAADDSDVLSFRHFDLLAEFSRRSGLVRRWEEVDFVQGRQSDQFLRIGNAIQRAE